MEEDKLYTEKEIKDINGDYRNKKGWTNQIKWYYLEKGKKREFWAFQKKISPLERKWGSFAVSKMIEREDINDRFYKSAYGDVMTDLQRRVFLNGVLVYANSEKAIILYEPQLNNKSSRRLVALNFEGKEVWRTQVSGNSNLLEFLPEKVSYSLFLRKVEGNKLILNYPYIQVEGKSGNRNITTGIDLETGKILWEYSPN